MSNAHLRTLVYINICDTFFNTLQKIYIIKVQEIANIDWS